MDNTQNNLPNPVQFFKPCTYPVAMPGKYLIGDKGDVINTYKDQYLMYHTKPRHEYMFVHITNKDNEMKIVPVHRLVAYEFCNGIEKMHDNPHVDHIDCNKGNAFYKNLEWVTPKENSHRAIMNKCGGYFPPGLDHPGCKTDEDEVREICKRLEYGIDWWECFLSFGYTRVQENKRLAGLIRSIKFKHSWTHISCNYNF